MVDREVPPHRVNGRGLATNQQGVDDMPDSKVLIPGGCSVGGCQVDHQPTRKGGRVLHTGVGILAATVAAYGVVHVAEWAYNQLVQVLYGVLPL